jgi:hypothetical protein
MKHQDKINSSESHNLPENQWSELIEDIEYFEQTAVFATKPMLESEERDRIKADMMRALVAKKHRRKLSRFIIAAAAVIMVSMAGLLLVINVGQETANDSQIMASGIWESESISETDQTIACLTDEIDALQSEMIAIGMSENNQSANSATDLELELIDLKSEFWKG